MTAIPRAEITTLTARYGDLWAPNRDVTAAEVRADADNRRYLADQHTDADRQRLQDEADALDTLADRYEQETA